MGSHSVTCHPAAVTFPAFATAEAGTRFSDPKGMQGWVDLGGGYMQDSLRDYDSSVHSIDFIKIKLAHWFYEHYNYNMAVPNNLYLLICMFLVT